MGKQKLIKNSIKWRNTEVRIKKIIWVIEGRWVILYVARTFLTGKTLLQRN